MDDEDDEGKCEYIEDEHYVPTEVDIRDYAVYLGINLDTEQDMMWLAVEGVSARLPTGWVPCCTKRGQVYYFDTRTGASSWTHPKDVEYKQRVREVREKRQGQQPRQPQQQQQRQRQSLPAAVEPPSPHHPAPLSHALHGRAGSAGGPSEEARPSLPATTPAASVPCVPPSAPVSLPSSVPASAAPPEAAGAPASRQRQRHGRSMSAASAVPSSVVESVARETSAMPSPQTSQPPPQWKSPWRGAKSPARSSDSLLPVPAPSRSRCFRMKIVSLPSETCVAQARVGPTTTFASVSHLLPADVKERTFFDAEGFAYPPPDLVQPHCDLETLIVYLKGT